MVGFTLIWASSSVSPPPMAMIVTKKGGSLRGFRNNDGGGGDGFPSFLPKEVHNIRDPDARTLAQRIERLPVKRLHCELPDSRLKIVPDSGHLAHVEKPIHVAKLIAEFARDD